VRITAKDAGLFTLREVTTAELRVIGVALEKRVIMLPQPDGMSMRMLEQIGRALSAIPVPD
jgi:hypothetical protein